MCGLVGFACSPSFILQEESLRTALANIRHRGPDDVGVFMDAEKGIGIGHARLSILELSSLGHQPMFSDDGHVVLVFNGEIYNFRELRAELKAMGHEFRGESDTEVLLHLYLEWRESGGNLAEMLRRINGIFAFALWDSDRGEILLARDALGVKPLYYCAEANYFTFASEIKALLPLVASLGPIDILAVHRYLSLLWCPGEATLASNVRKLGPGELIWVRNGMIKERSVWYCLPATRHTSFAMNESTALSGVVKHLRAAVHRQLVADVPVGAFLSGGLDSSSVVTFAREQNPNIRCFTIEPLGSAEQGVDDDLPYARRVAEHLSVPLEVVSVDTTRMVDDLTDMVAQLDEPLADLAPLNVLYISRLAREFGIKVLLSGAGGDDLFTGYRRHSAILAERYWDWLPELVRQGLTNLTSTLDQRWVWARRLRKVFDGAVLEGDARLVNYFKWSQRSDLIKLYTPEFRFALGDAEAATPMLDYLAGLPSDLVSLEKMLALEQRFFLADHNLIYTDKMSMATGVEVRVPFLDLELVNFAREIPIGFKHRGGEGKWVLKKAMEPYLPKDVIYRPKTGFGAPLRRFMRYELRELLADILSETSLRRRGLFDWIEVQKLIAANDTGKVDASYTLLSLVCIELWCRKFIDYSG